MSDSKIPKPELPGFGMFFLLGLILIALFWGINMWLTGGASGNADPQEAARAAFRIKTLAVLRAEDAPKLEKYAWADRTKGSVQIPIARAMEIVIPELAAQQSRAVCQFAAPAPSPATAPPPTPARSPAPHAN